ncbi:MAG: hypothetical protein QM699_04550 [Amaricoccus sp.]|uniref:hypothetical protein n=1 Tax=Amaricoccus sp. TaxID=1872485 RepID=UPI0039E383D7
MMHGNSPASQRGAVIALPIAREPVGEARLVAVSARVSALVFEAEDIPGPLMAFVDGARHDGALVGTRLVLRSGGLRQVVLIGLGAAEIRGRAVALARGGRVVAAIDPDWLQAPDAEVAALLEDLSEDGALRLLRLLLTTGASLFRDGGAEFAALARRLLAGLGVRALDPVAVCATGSDSRIVTWRVASAFEAGRLGDLVALLPGRPRRLARPPAHVEPTARGALLHVELPRRLPAGAVLVATGGAPLSLATPAAAASGDVPAFLAARDAATVRFAHRLIEARLGRDPVAAALVAELRHAAAPAPSLAVRHLSGTAKGIVFAFALDDPHGLVAAVRLVRGERSVQIPVAGRLEGYAALPRESAIDDGCRLGLVYRSGRVVPVAAAVGLARFDGTPPPGFADAAALAAARLDLDAPEGAPLCEGFGTSKKTPRLTIVAPLAADLDLLRARAALISAEPRGRAVEVICWTAECPTEPDLVPAARAAMAHVAAAWGVPHRLIVLPRGAGGADGLRAALRLARAPRVLALGAGVLPGEAGWLARCLRGRGVARAGGLRDHDGATIAAAPDAALLLGAGARDDAALCLPTPGAIAAAFAPRGAPVAGFVTYGAVSSTTLEAAADAAAVAIALKPSFSLACEESGA